MSIWTHVAGCIRVDSIDCIHDITPEIKKIFKSCSFDSPREDWDKCNMPCGTEGSVQWSLWVNPDKSAMASHVITLFGDLRCYGKDEEKEITLWWKRTISKLNTCKGSFGVRDAILSVRFEDSPTTLILDKLCKKHEGDNE